MNARSRYGLISLFLLTGIGLIWRLLATPEIAPRLLTLTLLLLGIDQTRMAIVDLDNIQQVRIHSDLANSAGTDDPRLNHFDWITRSTILLELIGFGIASYQTGWGGLIILASQIWFNLQAGIQLHPGRSELIEDFGIGDRAVVLAADALGIGLISLFLMQWFPIVSASALLGMVAIYLAVKYLPALLHRELRTDS